ncbi:CBS domain-containing protein [Pseudonocardiaceae bacterium YIM PH 21723]|nr:CBS domain-containing protein [Pseudonocardiaceae bacterium YIM PH 21723]
MIRARDIMHRGASWIDATDTVAEAARIMRHLDVGALPIRGDGDRMCGIVTDRDIVLRCVAAGLDPEMTLVKELAEGTPVWVDADAAIEEVLQRMEQHQIRRLPVVEHRRLVGMISQADLARHLSDGQVGEFVEAVCAG